MLADALKEKWNGSPWQRRGELFLWSKATAPGSIETRLIKPLTYMNGSGLAVIDALELFGLGPESLIVAHDDLDLPAGRLRIRPGGGHGGHNGIRSIMETIGTGDFARLKLGVGRPPQGTSTVDYVLGDYKNEEWLDLTAQLFRACEAVETILTRNVGEAMNRFNSAA